MVRTGKPQEKYTTRNMQFPIIHSSFIIKKSGGCQVDVRWIDAPYYALYVAHYVFSFCIIAKKTVLLPKFTNRYIKYIQI